MLVIPSKMIISWAWHLSHIKKHGNILKMWSSLLICAPPANVLSSQHFYRSIYKGWFERIFLGAEMVAHWSQIKNYDGCRAGVPQTVARLSHTVPHTQSWVLVPPILIEMCTSMWIKKAWLPCWPSRRQQVSHQRWIWGIHYTLAMNHTSKRSPRLWNLGQTSPEVQNKGISGPSKI